MQGPYTAWRDRGRRIPAPGAAGAGNSEDTLVLGVQIDHPLSFEHGKIHPVSAVHTGFLIHGDDDLQRGMGDGGIGQQSKAVGNSDAVISAQCGAIGENAGVIMGHIQTIHCKINGAIRAFLTHHVHVSLQDDRLVILIPRGTVLEHEDIVQLVLNVGKTVLLGKGHQIVADGLGIAGAVGDQNRSSQNNRTRKQAQVLPIFLLSSCFLL